MYSIYDAYDSARAPAVVASVLAIGVSFVLGVFMFIALNSHDKTQSSQLQETLKAIQASQDQGISVSQALDQLRAQSTQNGAAIKNAKPSQYPQTASFSQLSISGSTTVQGSLTVNKNFKAKGDSEVQGSGTYGGGLSVGDGLGVSGDSELQGDLTVAGSANLSGDLNVDGDSTLNGLTAASGSFSDLTVDGAARLGSLSVDPDGESSFGSLIVTGYAQLSDLSVDGLLTLGGLNISGEAGFSDLNVTGAGSFADLVSDGTATFNNLTSSGTADLSDITVSGTSTFTTLIVGDSASFNGGSLAVNGTGSNFSGSTINLGSIDATNNTGTITAGANTFTINGGLAAASGDVNINNSGDTTINNGITMNGTINSGGIGINLDASGTGAKNIINTVAGGTVNVVATDLTSEAGSTLTIQNLTVGDASAGDLTTGGNIISSGNITTQGALTADAANIGGIGILGDYMSIGSYSNHPGLLHVAIDPAGSGTRSISAEGTIGDNGSDFAEWISWSGSKPEVGSVIVSNGSAYVVSSEQTAGFIGNDSISGEANSVLVTFAGQVPVRVTGPVAAGDLLVNNGDGTARAINPGVASLVESLSKVAIAQEGSSDPGVKLVKAAVGTTSAGLQDNPQANASFGSLNVSGVSQLQDLAVTGAASVNNLTVTGLTTVAKIVVQGHIVGNDDTRGDVVVPSGSQTVHHDFAQPYDSKPIIVASPEGQAVPYSVTATPTGFDISLSAPASADIHFNYLVQQ